MSHKIIFIHLCKAIAIAFSTAILVNCTTKEVQLSPEEHQSEIDQWHSRRIEDLKDTSGWLNLAGLYWLKEGINTFGSGEENQVVFPEGSIAKNAGYFLVKNGVVQMEVNPDVEIKIGREVVHSVLFFHPDSSQAPVASHGSSQWFVIRRDKDVGIRLRDLTSKAVQEFKGIERFPVDLQWRVTARFQPTEGKTIDITNVLGQTNGQKSPGTLTFELGGETYSLDVLEGGKDEFFLIVGDKTNEKETYPSGRYLYVKKPNAEGEVIIDFNKAYNPPCAFTPFATCPLPPRQNILSVAIRAGEKNYSYDGGH
jgi:uncharacterized protein (DUF1684 family)